MIGQEKDGEYLSYHFDFRGSTVALSDSSGAVVEKFQYSPFGVLVKGNASKTPFLFNGMYGVMTDGNGLLYMRARFYNPEIRRFVNRDVLLGGIADGQTLNRFAFVSGDPIKYTDPFGLDRRCGPGEKAVTDPTQPHVAYCVKDGSDPYEKICVTAECLLQDAACGGNYEGSRPYVGIGEYVDYHLLLFGFTSEISIVSQGSSKTCVIRTDCGSIGPGIFGGAGLTAPLGIALSDIEDSLAGTSVGLSFDIGACWASYGASANAGFNQEGITSLGSSKGVARGGVGCGASLTIDFCKSTILRCDQP